MQLSEEPNKEYTIKEVARIVQTSVKSVYDQIQKGVLNAHIRPNQKLNKYFCTNDDIEAYIKRYALAESFRVAHGWKQKLDQIRKQLMTEHDYVYERDLIHALGYSKYTIRTWRQHWKFPQPTSSEGTYGYVVYNRQAVIDWLRKHPKYWTESAHKFLTQ